MDRSLVRLLSDGMEIRCLRPSAGAYLSDLAPRTPSRLQFPLHCTGEGVGGGGGKEVGGRGQDGGSCLEADCL